MCLEIATQHTTVARLKPDASAGDLGYNKKIPSMLGNCTTYIFTRNPVCKASRILLAVRRTLPKVVALLTHRLWVSSLRGLN